MFSPSSFFRLIPCIAMACCPSVVLAEELNSGIDNRGMDRSVRVQDDLFLAGNGQWLKHTPIPAEKSTYGAFEILGDQSQQHVLEIFKETTTGNYPDGSDEKKIGDFFKSYMNTSETEQRGIEPLREQLAKVDDISNVEDLVRHWGYLQTIGVTTPIGFYVDQDDKQSDQHLAAIIQGGLSLPDRDYYLEDGPKYEKARAALKTYINKIFELAELPADPNIASDILSLEKQFAQHHWERTELRDAEKRYNKHTIQELIGRAPDIAWSEFFTSAGTQDLAHVNVNTPSFMEALQDILETTDLDTWKQYTRYHIVDSYAMALSEDFVAANFELYGKQLRGMEELKPRWKRAVEAIAGARGMGALGEAVGRMYVERHFPAEAKERMDVLVKNLLQSFDESIDQLEWMTPETKERAHEKLKKINTKIGHPTKWRDYSALEVSDNDLVGNLMRSARVEHQRMLDKLGSPVDREEWFMTPQTVNAYYSPSLNEIVFPAAILQPPYFDFTADDAANYGSIGAIIGHEISHAFDDQGSKFDGDGNLKNWWTDEDRKSFQDLTGKLVEQYEGYSPLTGRNVNGQLTLGENIADLSGMSVAYKAYELSLDGNEAPEIDGWTGPQRFFLSWSQSWRRQYRDAEMVNRLLTDPHAPAAYRANGPVTNFTPFYEAFELLEGDGLFKPAEERIRIW